MKIQDIFNKDNISFDVKLDTKEDVLQYLTEQLYTSNSISSQEEFYKAVMYRESLSETGLGDSIAIPHGKSSTVNQPSIAFVRLDKPIEWESLDDLPIQYIFLLAIPENSDSDEHIKMISELARSLIKPEVIEAVQNAQSYEELLGTF